MKFHQFPAKGIFWKRTVYVELCANRLTETMRFQKISTPGNSVKSRYFMQFLKNATTSKYFFLIFRT